MRYCRKGPDSDVYLYTAEDENENDWLVCHECLLNGMEDWWMQHGAHEVLNHLIVHQNEGHKIPAAVMERLRNEIR
jgi:hypothetical protein